MTCSRSLLALIVALTAPAMRAQDPVSENPAQSFVSENGHLDAEMFTSADFGEMSRTSGVTQDQAGLLYAGNDRVVLAFDGQTWRSLRTDQGLVVALAVSRDDRIWVASVGGIGCLESDGRGGRRFWSLQESIPSPERTFGQFLGVETCAHGVYFFADRDIVRWHEEKPTIFHDRRGVGHASDGLIFATDERGVLQSFDGRRWRDFADFPAIRRNRLTGIVHLADQSWLISTAQDGLWRFNQGQLARFPTAVDAQLLRGGDHRLDRLRDGTIVISLWSGGLAFLDAAGRVVQQLNSDPAGRPLPRIRALHQDRAGDIWITHANGVERIPWPASFSIFDFSNGLPRAAVKDFARFRRHFYAATSQGLYVLEPSRVESNHLRPARFRLVRGCQEQVWAMAVLENSLVLVGPSVRVVVPGQSPVRLESSVFTTGVVAVPGRPERAIIGSSNGCFLLQQTDGKWTLTPFHPSPPLADNRLLISGQTLWIGASNAGYFRVPDVFAALAGANADAVEHYPGGHGFESDRLEGTEQVAAVGDQVFFADGGGIYSFDAEARRFAPRFKLPVAPGARPPLISEMRTAHRGLWLETRITDPEQDRWGRHLIWRADSDLVTLPHAILKNTGAAQAFLEEPAAHGTVAWIGGDDGVVRIELPAAELRPVTFRAVVRQVMNRSGNQLPLTGSAPQLGAAHSELTINYSTDRLDDRSTRFQTRLDGRDDDWSRPTTATAFTAAGLRAGRYTLHIRARDIDGRFSEPAQFSFVVLPPWWETWWAIGAYVLVCALAIAGFIRWRLRTVERRNHELETLIAARTQELRTAKVGAESANQAKSVFLASMNHELRTPLNAILGYSQILRKEIGLSTKGRRQLEIVGRNGEHLLQMINEVLDLAKIEAGKMSLHATEFPLMRVVKTAADIFELRANDKGLTFRLEIGAGLPKIVSSDESKLRQVLFNLLGNAVKFTTHGEVVFAVAREHGARRKEQGYASSTAASSLLPASGSKPDFVRFSVTDTGPGIPADQLQAIFLPFHQAATPSASAQGTGLGLTISQRIVELLGGRIQVESTVGRGSRFWFDLPLREVSIARSSAVPRRICGYRGPRRRVLIADSDETNRAVLRDLLEPLGFVVDEADDASACITQMETNPPDVVLLDPRRSAPGDAEPLSLLRALPPERRRPIIAISASVFEFDQQQALAAGCDDFLPKPIHETRLLESLGRVLALEWEFLETAKPPESASAAPADDRELPRPEELAALDDLLFAGDVAGLRDRISNALARGEPGSRFLHQLDQLAAAFKTAEIRQKLTEARSHVSRA